MRFVPQSLRGGSLKTNNFARCHRNIDLTDDVTFEGWVTTAGPVAGVRELGFTNNKGEREMSHVSVGA